MKYGNTVAFTTSGQSPNVLRDTDFNTNYEEGPIRVRALCITPKAPSASNVPDITVYFRAGSQILTETKVNQLGAVGTASAGYARSEMRLCEDDLVVNEESPSGNIQLYFVSSTDDAVVMFDIETPGVT